MKVLFIGLGSVGQRHLQNVSSLLPDAELLAYRRTSHGNVIKDLSIQPQSVEKFYPRLRCLTDLEEAKRQRPDLVFITNPSSMHVETAIAFAEQGSHIFIEKPLGLSLSGVERLEELVEEKSLTVMVGYQMRFNPLYQKVRDTVKKNRSKLISASFEWNTYVPLHHPYEDYAKSYVAREETGGGVVLALIHEVDVVYDLFGVPSRIFGLGGKLSELDWTGDDTIMSILDYGSDRSVPVYLNLSMAQTKETRRWRFQFTDGTLLADLVENSFALYDDQARLVEQGKDDTIRNQFFISEVEHFIDCARRTEKPLTSLEEGKASLAMALAIKEAVKKGDWL